ncbi:IclR family transcriptional regulator [Albimonas sp. CAU 1670]|uniref:IclR family transcriptional regulator n=1 Tax=Albimonas sp. CAU 1670 TaxID=3032599 RepID=UPI0023DCE52F|nr:IclR family transcriptional regulator [Albimonas sp. CAU 1670]MDF2234752.1 IclR family transcriptional regulator [Albimonas sp. CAU 1670]
MTQDHGPEERRSERPGVASVRAVERAAAILSAFDAEAPRLTLSEIAAHAELDKNTARRLLHTLEAVGWVLHFPRERRYALGPGLMALQPAVFYERRLRDVAAPVLARLAAHSGMTAFLWTEFRGHAFCVDRVRAQARLAGVRWTEVGRLMPINCSGGPRMVMASMDPARRAEVLAGPLHAFTPASCTDPAKLEADARAIAARGWELAVDDYSIGMAGLAAPIHDPAGRFRAVISLTDLSRRLAPGPDGLPPHLDALLEAVAEIGTHLDAEG